MPDSIKTEDSKPKRQRKPKVPKAPGVPRRKSGKKREEAHRRALELAAARAVTHQVQRQIMVDCLVRQWIDAETLRAEPFLQDMMWVGYRYMTPIERTELFTNEYIKAYRRAYGLHCGDQRAAAKKQPVQASYVLNDVGDMNCLWTARATADALGVPYDMYLDTVMDGKMRNGKWIEPPLPNQLYSRTDPARLRDRPTPVEVGERIFCDDWDQRFFADAYRGDQVQEAALKLLHADVWAAPNPARRLAEYFGRQAISEARARAMFGGAMVEAALAFGGAPSVKGKVQIEPYVPNCFGYPAAGHDSPCWRCPAARNCAAHVQQVRETLIATTGSDNPRLARERAQTAERQRRWYANKKQADRESGAG